MNGTSKTIYQVAIYRLNLGYVIGMHVNIYFVIVRTSLIWRIINNQQKVFTD